jgi:hypothetical protein
VFNFKLQPEIMKKSVPGDHFRRSKPEQKDVDGVRRRPPRQRRGGLRERQGLPDVDAQDDARSAGDQVPIFGKAISAGLPDFSRYKIPKRLKIYQITTNYAQCP